VVEEIAQSIGAPVQEIIASPQLLERVDRKLLSAGTFTVNDILEELRKPGRDPRSSFIAPSFHEGVRELSDVQENMVLEGVVTNVTKFGAFVDVGVHQDGLVHISEISNRFIKDPAEVLKAGQIVKVKVLSCDLKSKRIALSIKALLPGGGGVPKPREEGRGKPQEKTNRPAGRPAEEKSGDFLAVLSTKWKVAPARK
jgi:uncharacterized protein